MRIGQSASQVAIAGVLALLIPLFSGVPTAGAEKGKKNTKTTKVVRDDFDEKLSLDWKPVRHDPSHVSLKDHPGKLTIVTQRGSIHGDETNDDYGEGLQAKNLFLIDNPFPEGLDFRMTTLVEDFCPESSYQQAGLICYDDDDNYLKWGYEWCWPRGEGHTFTCVVETDQEPAHDAVDAKSDLKQLWLRIAKQGNAYKYSYSYDGKKFTVAGQQIWSDGSPAKLGILAKNGGSAGASELPCQFDFFEVRRKSKKAAPLVTFEDIGEITIDAADSITMQIDQMDIEEMMAKEREEFMKAVQEDPEWRPSHEETNTIQPVPDSEADAIHNFCLDEDGNLLVCCGGERYTYETDGNAYGGYTQRKIEEPSEIRVLSPAGELLKTWPMEFKPEAIAVHADGTIFVGGSGKVARLTAKGEISQIIDLRSLAKEDAATEAETVETEAVESEGSLVEAIAGVISGAIVETVEVEADDEEIQKALIKALMQEGKSREEAEQTLVEMQEAETASQEQYARMVNGIAVTDNDLFVACPMGSGYGFAIWRFDHDLKNAKRIVEGLRGCCGQMDVQARGDRVYVAENARHRVICYNRDGDEISKFGKRKRQAPEGFGGCCEPKNLRLDGAGNLYACESGPPVIVRKYTADGEFLGVIGYPTFTTGCVRVTVAINEAENRVYVLNFNGNQIHVLKPVTGE